MPVTYFSTNLVYPFTPRAAGITSVRTVTKGLKASTEVGEITARLKKLGHNPRYVYNPPGEHGKAKRDIFFVELELAKNNKNFYNTRVIVYQVVTIKPQIQRKVPLRCFKCQ